MTDPLLHTWQLNLGYAQRLVADIPDGKMALQPAPGMNHPAWVLGHLACTADMLGAMVGVTLLKALEEAHAGIAAALPGVSESRWSETTPLDAVRGFLPTLGDCFVFVMAAHRNMHLGQLSAWRRIQGMGRV